MSVTAPTQRPKCRRVRGATSTATSKISPLMHAHQLALRRSAHLAVQAAQRAARRLRVVVLHRRVGKVNTTPTSGSQSVAFDVSPNPLFNRTNT